MQRIGLGVCLVPVRLSRLRKQDEWRGIGRLETEREIKEDERIDVELGEAENVQANPDCDDHRLCHEKHWCPKKAGEGLGLQREPIITKDRGKMKVRKVEAQVVMIRRAGRCGDRIRC